MLEHGDHLSLDQVLDLDHLAQLVPHLGDPISVQRRLEFSLAPGLDWSVLCYLDLEALKDNGGRKPAATVVDLKVKRSLIPKRS